MPLFAVLGWLSAVGGVGGGVLMLLALTWMVGLEVAVPTLALAQLSSNGCRVWLNRTAVRARLVGWHAVGAVPFALAGGLLLAHMPPGPLQRILGGCLIATILWRRLRLFPVRPGERWFVAVGGFTGLASSMLGAAGPIAAPFFLAYGLVGEAYIGTEAAASVVVHLSKVAAYGTADLLSVEVLVLAAGLMPAILGGSWVGKKTVQRMSNRLFVVVIEIGVLFAGVGFLIGL
nr:sulfite exporter TauE/SafE family protein [Jiangella mangrovi]